MMKNLFKEQKEKIVEIYLLLQHKHTKILPWFNLIFIFVIMPIFVIVTQSIIPIFLTIIYIIFLSNLHPFYFKHIIKKQIYWIEDDKKHI